MLYGALRDFANEMDKYDRLSGKQIIEKIRDRYKLKEMLIKTIFSIQYSFDVIYRYYDEILHNGRRVNSVFLIKKNKKYKSRKDQLADILQELDYYLEMKNNISGNYYLPLVDELIEHSLTKLALSPDLILDIINELYEINNKFESVDNYNAKRKLMAQYKMNHSDISVVVSQIDVILESINRIDESIVNSNIKLVYAIALRKAYTSEIQMDLVQEGFRGLMYAIEKFDPNKNIHFSTYSSYWISVYIDRGMKKIGRIIHIPLNRYKDINKIHTYINQYIDENGRHPSYSDIIKHTNIPIKALLNVIHILLPLINVNKVTDTLMYEDDIEHIHNYILLNNIFEGILSKINPKYRDMISDKFGFIEGYIMTDKELSNKYNKSASFIHKYIKQAIKGMKHEYD